MAIFGERLRELRCQVGLSQADLAGAELSASYISLLEAGKRTPSPEVVNLLAERLGCSSSQLHEGRASERDQRIDLELAYARLAVEHGESVDARSRLKRLLTENDLPPRVHDTATFLLGTAFERLGEYEDAVKILSPLFARAAHGGCAVDVLQVGLLMCRCLSDVGDINRAVTTGEAALDRARKQGLNGSNDYYRLAATVMHGYTERGDFVHARLWAEQLIDEAERSGHTTGQAALYWNSAIRAELEGRLTEAVALSERALSQLSASDNHRDYARLRLTVAQICLGSEPPEVARADDLLTSCHADLNDLGSRYDMGVWNHVKSAVLLHQGNAAAAEGRARQAIELLGQALPADLVAAWAALSDAVLAQGRDDEARQCLQNAVQVVEGIDRSRTYALVFRDLAERSLHVGLTDDGLDLLRRSLECASVRDRSRAVRHDVDALRRAAEVGTPGPVH